MPDFLSHIEAIPVPFVVVKGDPSGFRVVSANAAALASMGDEGDLAGATLDGLATVWGEEIVQAVQEASRSGKPVRIGNLHWLPEGSAVATPLVFSGESTRSVALALYSQEPIRLIRPDRRRQDTQRRNRMLSAVADFMAALLKYQQDDWWKAINEAFQVVGKALEVDRVYYFENTYDPASGRYLTSQRLEWNDTRSEPQIDNPELQLTDLANDIIESEEFRNGRAFVAIVDELAPSGFKELLESQSIKSLLLAPLIVENDIHGYIGLDDCTNLRVWMEDEMVLMQTLATNMGLAIEKKRVHESLKESQRQFESVIRNMPGIAYRSVNDGTGRILFISDEIERLTGFPVMDFLTGNLCFGDIVHQDDKEKRLHALQQTLEGESFHVQYRLLDCDNNILWVDERGTGIHDENGAYRWVEGVIVDITRQKHREVELQVSNERFDLVMKAASEAIIDWDLATNQTVWGNGFHDIFGYDLEDAGNKIWADNIYEEDRPRVIRHLHEVLDNPNAALFFADYRFYKANRQVASVQHRGIILRDANGKPVRAVSTLIDMTETKQRLERIERQNERLREIAWIQTHVVRAPLARIMALVELMMLENGNDGQISSELLRYLVDSATELDGVINSIVNTSAKIELD